MTSQQMRFGTDDVEAARDVLGRAVAGEAVRVVTLTDEQVLVLDGVQHEQIVPLPWLDEQGEVDRELVGRVALRSMLSQGIVEARPRPDGEDVSIEAVPEITGSLVLRRTAQAILALERTTSLGKSWVFCYVHEGAGVLEEDVTTSGHHRFSVYSADLLGDRFGTFLDPTEAAVMAGRARTMTTEQFERDAPTMPELAEALVVTTLSVVRAGSETMINVSVYAGPRGVFVLRGGLNDDEGNAVLTLTEAGPSDVRSLPGELVVAP